MAGFYDYNDSKVMKSNLTRFHCTKLPHHFVKTKTGQLICEDSKINQLNFFLHIHVCSNNSFQSSTHPKWGMEF